MSRGIKTKGFTIIELLTVMSIIIILISVLVPALSRVRRFSRIVVQKGQFHEISKGLELYRNEHSETYPDSGPTAPDSTGATPAGYCGAMKMCEALLGQDGMGFHPSSRFTVDGTIIEPNGTSHNLYPFNLCTQIGPTDPLYAAISSNLQERTKYVDVESFKAARLQDLYSWNVSIGQSFYDAKAFSNTYQNAVITDVFLRADIKSLSCSAKAGQKVGMPVLYYKADPSKQIYDINNMYPVAPNPNIYNFDDNYGITFLGCPWEGGAAPTTAQPMASNPLLFYRETINTKITATPRPHNEDGYILMSAGWDGLYGTRDDVFNFAD